MRVLFAPSGTECPWLIRLDSEFDLSQLTLSLSYVRGDSQQQEVQNVVVAQMNARHAEALGIFV